MNGLPGIFALGNPLSAVKWLLFLVLTGVAVTDRLASDETAESGVTTQSIDEVEEWEEDDMSQP